MECPSRLATVIACAAALCACGGGSGGSATDGGGGSTTSVSVDTTAIETTTLPTDSLPSREVTLTIADISEPKLYLAASFSTNAVAGVDHTSGGLSQERIFIQFKAPSSLPDGVYQDTIELRVCTTDTCSRQVKGSPIRISSTMTIESPGSLQAEQQTLNVAAGVIDPTVPIATPRFTVAGIPADSGVHFSVTSSTNGIAQSPSAPGFGIDANVYLEFRRPADVGVGVYEDTLTLQACYDSSCLREVAGSPATVHVAYTVSLEDPGFPPLPIATRTALPHDVLDAEYSAALDALVMIAAYPRNALYVYYLATGDEREVALSSLPATVAVAPDGRRAVVGHDSMITDVDLVADVLPGAPPPQTFATSIDVFDVALDYRSVAHSISRDNRGTTIFSVDLATGMESTGTATAWPGSHIRLHPGGDFVYTAVEGISPSVVYKFDVTSGAGQFLYEWPYHGEQGVCGDLWFDEPGTMIYGRCGSAFRSSTAQSQDMTYAGRLALTPSDGYAFLVDWASHSAETHEVAVLESGDASQCSARGGDPLRCRSHLGLHNDVTLQRDVAYSLVPVEVAGVLYPQRGMFVFHSGDGLRRYLVSRLSGVPDPNSQYYVTTMP